MHEPAGLRLAATPLQRAWVPVRAALDEARRELDAEAFAVFVSMLGIVVARWETERLEREWGGGLIVGDPVERARELLVFAEGFDAAGGGNAELARRARVAARDVLELGEALEAERSARVAIQERAQVLNALNSSPPADDDIDWGEVS